MTIVNADLSDVVPMIPKIGPRKEMLSLRLVDGKYYIRINSSSLGVIQECSRKSRYLLHEKWASDNESPATLFGSAIHAALEVFYRGGPDFRQLPSLEDMELMSYGHEVEGEKTSLLLQATRAFLTKAAPLKDLPETDKRSLQGGMWILYNYFKVFAHDPYVTYVDAEGPFVERKVEYELYDDEYINIVYFGTIDLGLRHSVTSEIHICDHKTSSVVGSDFYNRLKPNHQYTGYLLGARKVFGIDTNSFLVNCLQVKEKPKTSRGTPPNFPRQITTRSEEDYQEFTDAVCAASWEYIRAKQSGTWPIGHVNACAMYGGCQYLQVCGSPNNLRETVLKSKFTRGDISEAQ